MIFKFLHQTPFKKFNKNNLNTIIRSFINLSLSLLIFTFSQTSMAYDFQLSIYTGFDEKTLGEFKEFKEDNDYYNYPSDEDRKLSSIIKHYNLGNRRDVQQLTYICELQNILEESSITKGSYTYDDLFRNANKAEKLLKNKIDADVFETVLKNYRKHFQTYRTSESEFTGVEDRFTDFYPIVFELTFPKPVKVKISEHKGEGGGDTYFYILEKISNNKYLYFEIPPKKFNEEDVDIDETNYKKYKPADKISTVKNWYFTCLDKSYADFVENKF